METNKNLFLKASELMKGNWLSIIILLIIPTIISSVADGLDKIVTKNFQTDPVFLNSWFIFYFLLSVVVVFVSALFQIGVIKYINKNYLGTKITIKESLKTNWKIVIAFVVLDILISIMTFIPTLLLIIPGIIFSILIYFSNLIFVIKEKNILDALTFNYYLIKGKIRTVINKFLYPILLFLPYFLGIVILLVPLAIVSDLYDQKSIIIIAIILAIPLLYKIIKIIIISITYIYLLFLELEKNIELPNDESELLSTKRMIRNYIIISILVGIIFIVSLFFVFRPFILPM